MRCQQALERMMAADPAELRRERDTPLARHLRQCARCSAVADALTTDLHALGVAFHAYGDAGDPADAARRAISAPSVEPPDARRAPPRVGKARLPRGSWVPLAAAAAVAALLVLGWPDGWRDAPDASEGPDAATAAADARAGGAGPRVSVRPPVDQTAVVMETRNPEITIVWLYPREDT